MERASLPGETFLELRMRRRGGGAETDLSYYELIERPRHQAEAASCSMR